MKGREEGVEGKERREEGRRKRDGEGRGGSGSRRGRKKRVIRITEGEEEDTDWGWGGGGGRGGLRRDTFLALDGFTRSMVTHMHTHTPTHAYIQTPPIHMHIHTPVLVREPVSVLLPPLTAGEGKYHTVHSQLSVSHTNTQSSDYSTRVPWMMSRRLHSLIPRPTQFSVLWFAFTMIHGCGSGKKREKSGIIHHVNDVRQTWRGGGGGGGGGGGNCK